MKFTIALSGLPAALMPQVQARAQDKPKPPNFSVLLTAFLALPLLSSGTQSLHSFAGRTGGAYPAGGLAPGANGVLYGTIPESLRTEQA